MTYSFHVDERFGHVTVTNEHGDRIADVIDGGDVCKLSVPDRFMTASEAYAAGAALQQWSVAKWRQKR